MIYVRMDAEEKMRFMSYALGKDRATEEMAAKWSLERGSRPLRVRMTHAAGPHEANEDIRELSEILKTRGAMRIDNTYEFVFPGRDAVPGLKYVFGLFPRVDRVEAIRENTVSMDLVDAVRPNDWVVDKVTQPLEIAIADTMIELVPKLPTYPDALWVVDGTKVKAVMGLKQNGYTTYSVASGHAPNAYDRPTLIVQLYASKTT